MTGDRTVLPSTTVLSVAPVDSLVSLARRRRRCRAGERESALPDLPDLPENFDVVVIGAGLAGMAAALGLVDAGLSVVVLEAAGRTGGRVHTLHRPDLPNGRLDLGARQIGIGYKRTWSLLRRFGLSTVDEDPELQSSCYFINEVLVSAADWPRSNHNHLEEPFRLQPPNSLGPAWMAQINPFESFTDWLDPRFSHLDVAPAALLRAEGASEERLRLTALSISGGDLWQHSTLALLQEHHRTMEELRTTSTNRMPIADTDRAKAIMASAGIERRPIQNIVGGTSALLDAVAGVLGDAVRFDSAVSSLSIVEGVTGGSRPCEVRTHDGRTFLADRVVAAVPFTLLRSIVITPRPEPLLAEAIQTMPYLALSRTWARVQRPFWEDDGFAPSTFSDGGFGSCLIMRDPATGEYTAMFVASGATAKRVNANGMEASMHNFLQGLVEARPAAKGALAPFAASSWENEPFSKGLRHGFRPGDVTRFAPVLARPHGPGGRLHLAGEHTRREEFGMEAALESSDRVVHEILAGAGGNSA